MSAQEAIVHIIIWLVTGIAVVCAVTTTNDQTCFWSFIFPTMVSLMMVRKYIKH